MKLRFLLPLIFFGFVAFLLWRGLHLHPNQIPSPLIGKAAPTFTLPTLADAHKTTTEKAFKNQVTLVNVWATWCYSCAYEHEFYWQLPKSQD